MNTQTEKTQKQPDKSTVMNRIAMIVTRTVIIATGLIGLILIITGFSSDDYTIEKAISFIGQTLLPLWGTWFGTILAFYFTKENLDAANKSNQDLIKQLSERDRKFASKSVCSVMKPYDEIITLNMEDDGERVLSVILGDSRFEDFNRFPVFSSKKQSQKLEYMVHRLLIYKYLDKLSEDDKKSKTLKDFLIGNLEVQKDLKDSVGYVSENATLLDAKNEMDKLENCKDVFVTKDGKNTGMVIGWISNKDIYEYGNV